MTISFPLPLPSSPDFARITLMEDVAVAVTESPFTFHQQVVEHAGQRWRAELELPPMKQDESEEWIATLTSLRGRVGTFHLGDPARTSPRGNGFGSPVVDGAGQTGQTLETRGWTINNALQLLPGDYIQLGSGSTQRLYMVTKTVASDSNGDATIDIWPRLRESPADGEALVLNDTQGTFALESPIDIPRRPGLITQISFSAVEAL